MNVGHTKGSGGKQGLVRPALFDFDFDSCTSQMLPGPSVRPIDLYVSHTNTNTNTNTYRMLLDPLVRPMDPKVSIQIEIQIKHISNAARPICQTNLVLETKYIQEGWMFKCQIHFGKSIQYISRVKSRVDQLNKAVDDDDEIC